MALACMTPLVQPATASEKVMTLMRTLAIKGGGPREKSGRKDGRAKAEVGLGKLLFHMGYIQQVISAWIYAAVPFNLPGPLMVGSLIL